MTHDTPALPAGLTITGRTPEVHHNETHGWFVYSERKDCGNLTGWYLLGDGRWHDCCPAFFPTAAAAIEFACLHADLSLGETIAARLNVGFRELPRGGWRRAGEQGTEQQSDLQGNCGTWRISIEGTAATITDPEGKRSHKTANQHATATHLAMALDELRLMARKLTAAERERDQLRAKLDTFAHWGEAVSAAEDANAALAERVRVLEELVEAYRTLCTAYRTGSRHAPEKALDAITRCEAALEANTNAK